MRRFLMIGLLLGALPLAGCATSGGGTTGGGVPGIDPGTVAQVQQVAAQVCGFVPTAVTVASVIATFTGGGAIVDMVGQAANGICNAVNAKVLGRRAGPPRFRGVVIQGHRV